MAAESINYAQYAGIHSVAAAVIFLIAYVPLAILYIIYSIRRPTYVLIVLALFCIIRITAFSIRAAMAASTSAGESEGLLVAEEILYNAGFFGVLYSAYTLVLDRDQLTGRLGETQGLLTLLARITSNRHVIRLTLSVAVALGITGATKMVSSNSSDVSTGESLRRASVYIFLVVTAVLVLRTLILAMHQGASRPDNNMELGASQRPKGNTTFGARHGIYVLAIITLLLLIREAFYAATTGSTNASQQAKGNNEAYFYPLGALTEFLAVILFAVPGLVPSRKELEMQRYAAEK